MINFFVLPFEPSQWKTASSDLRIDPTLYRKRMQQRWPQAKIYTPPSNSTYLLRWQLNQEGEIGSSGGLQEDQQTVSIKPISKSSLLEFVRWHREVISEKYQLFLTWEESWDSVELKSDTSAKDFSIIPL